MVKRALSVSEILRQELDVFDLSQPFQDAFGKPQTCGVWFIWGQSGNGKTSFAIQLCKELCEYGVVLYNSLEEGFGLTMKNTLKRFQMMDVNKRFRIISEDIETLKIRLRKRRSPKIVVIDSFQYTQLQYKQYIKFKEEFPRHLIIFISQADGKQPSGKSAKSVMYDADLKIYVEGYRAFSKGRYYGQVGHIDVWTEEAEKYWGKPD